MAQNIILYATANDVLARIRDRANAKALTAPTFAKGVAVALKVRLFANSADTTPYPLSQLSTITSWSCSFDTDWDSSTTYKMTADAGQISVSSVTDNGTTYTELSIPISSTNTTEIATWLGNKEVAEGLNAEIVGCVGQAEQFVLQIKGFSFRNRLGSQGTPTVVDPEYLTATQVRGLIASGVNIQYSTDGVSWHTSQADTDRYLRFQSASSTTSAWTSAIQLPTGADGEDGADGASAYVYIRYASDTSGTGFSPAPSSSLPYVGIIATNSQIANPTASDFVGKWVRFVGEQGASGTSSYTYVAYASSAQGANFSLTPTSGLKYRAEIHPTTPIENPTASDFSSATWVKYIGEDGSGSGDMTKAVYDTDNDGVVDSAKKLSTARSIGSASFDGTADITLAQIGAQPALPSGTTGHYLKKTASGVEWASVSGGGSSAWGSITGDITAQSDLNTALSGKISSPSTGVTGQFLQKTASGVQWADSSATTDYSALRTVDGENDFQNAVSACRDQGKCVSFTIGAQFPTSAISGVSWERGHLYLVLPLDFAGFAEISLGLNWTESQRRYYYRLEKSTIVYQGATYECTPYSNGDSEGCSTTDNGFTALNGKFLRISDTERIHVMSYESTQWDGVWHQTYNAISGWQSDYTVSSFSISYAKSRVASYGSYSSSPATYLEKTIATIGDVTSGILPRMASVLSGSSNTIKAGGVYKWDLTANSTLSISPISNGTWGEAQIDLKVGSFTLTAGGGLTIADTLASGKLYHCIIRWRGSTARLKVVDEEEVASAVTYTYFSSSFSDEYNNGVYTYDSTSNTAVCDNTAGGDKRRIEFSNGCWRVKKWSGSGWIDPSDNGYVMYQGSGQTGSIDADILGTKQWWGEWAEMNETITITKNA